jgi:hypothetical protein
VLVVQSDPPRSPSSPWTATSGARAARSPFRTLERDGRLVLRQEGTSGAGVWDSLYDAGSKLSWRQQAANLRAAIYGGQRADFP